jgi:hypothetical protein
MTDFVIPSNWAATLKKRKNIYLKNESWNNQCFIGKRIFFDSKELQEKRFLDEFVKFGFY